MASEKLTRIMHNHGLMNGNHLLLVVCVAETFYLPSNVAGVFRNNGKYFCTKLYTHIYSKQLLCVRDPHSEV